MLPKVVEPESPELLSSQSCVITLAAQELLRDFLNARNANDQLVIDAICRAVADGQHQLESIKNSLQTFSKAHPDNSSSNIVDQEKLFSRLTLDGYKNFRLLAKSSFRVDEWMRQVVLLSADLVFRGPESYAEQEALQALGDLLDRLTPPSRLKTLLGAFLSLKRILEGRITVVEQRDQLVDYVEDFNEAVLHWCICTEIALAILKSGDALREISIEEASRRVSNRLDRLNDLICPDSAEARGSQ